MPVSYSGSTTTSPVVRSGVHPEQLPVRVQVWYGPRFWIENCAPLLVEYQTITDS
jgi:hypothetical protein